MDHEVFIIWSPDVPCGIQTFAYESRAQQEAEALARQHRGARFYIAKVTAFVKEPLPDLQWSDGRPAGAADGLGANCESPADPGRFAGRALYDQTMKASTMGLNKAPQR